MEGKEVGAKNAKVAKRKPDPEIGSGDYVDVLAEIVERALADGLVGVVQNMADNVKNDKHVPTTKTLMDLLERLKAMKKLPRAQHESFAAVLWKEFQRLEEKQGNRE